jgi:hypothetical protein
MRHLLIPGLAITIAACQTTDNAADAAKPSSAGAVGALPTEAHMLATEVRDQAALERLRGNSGLTLQWIDWNRRGTLEVTQRGDVVHLKGSQVAADGKGRLEIEGDVVSIDATGFILRGRITITDTPDTGRKCVKVGDSPFAITQGRRYWRMREFEWCDQLTDYIDIYFN